MGKSTKDQALLSVIGPLRRAGLNVEQVASELNLKRDRVHEFFQVLSRPVEEQQLFIDGQLTMCDIDKLCSGRTTLAEALTRKDCSVAKVVALTRKQMQDRRGYIQGCEALEVAHSFYNGDGGDIAHAAEMYRAMEVRAKRADVLEATLKTIDRRSGVDRRQT